MEILRLTGMDIDTVERDFPTLKADFGGGLGDAAKLTANGGLHRWAISSGCLPGDDAYGSLIEGTNRFDYYFDFFKTHTIGADEIFVFVFRGKTYHAGFVENGIDFERFTDDLFAGGVEIEQRRVEGFAYNADGSMDVLVVDLNGDLIVDDDDAALLFSGFYNG
jgi:hypothetical protein